MKKTLFAIGLCAIILSMPTVLAFPTQNHSLLFSPLLLSDDGTFAGGMGRGHWGHGFVIDSVYAYMHGVYTSGVFTKISGDLTNSDNVKIGEIKAYFIYKIIIGYKITQGHQTSLVGYMMKNSNNQFVGRILGVFGSTSHIWGQFIPNT
ncbi:hypothetical protein AYK25_05440 [Thermoplasmatales archaeon SM1-50]|nr:MAG: hypothetical protein AYK25_05440 [Thermoplasmatales archaeon SM1-50]